MRLVVIVGRLGADAELTTTSNGIPVTKFSLAVEKNGRNQNKETMWVKVSLWGNLAEKLHEYLTKGKMVLISGELDISEYTNKAGFKVPSVEIIARNVKLLSKGESTRQQVKEEEVDDMW